MKLTDNQKVAIYASALQGLLINPENRSPAESAIIHGDELIAAIEAKGEKADPHEPVADA